MPLEKDSEPAKQLTDLVNQRLCAVPKSEQSVFSKSLKWDSELNSFFDSTLAYETVQNLSGTRHSVVKKIYPKDDIIAILFRATSCSNGTEPKDHPDCIFEIERDRLLHRGEYK